MSLGEKIKTYRLKQDLSQAKLGELLNVTQQAVAKWEKSIAEPDSSAIKKMASLFHTSIDDLFEFSEITQENKALGIDRRAIYLSEDEFDWLELRSLIIEAQGEQYLKTLQIILSAIPKK